MKNIDKEYILCSAIKRINPKEITCYHKGINDIGEIELGYRHCDIYARFKNEVDKSPYAQGFYTSKGRFVDRKEAMKIAIESGQISEDIGIQSVTQEGKINYRSLYSEDLY